LPSETSADKQIQFATPQWLEQYADAYSADLNLQTRMMFVIGAARENVLRKSGGPFAAAIFNMENGTLVSLGVNLVTQFQNSILHAEVVAIMLAQKALGHFDLGDESLSPHELISSSEPCAMCIGATNWSGVHKLAYSANVQDAADIGFDEGPISPTWKNELRARGMSISEEVLREEARDVLQLYHRQGGELYNGGKPGKTTNNN